MRFTIHTIDGKTFTLEHDATTVESLSTWLTQVGYITGRQRGFWGKPGTVTLFLHYVGAISARAA